MIKKNRKNKGFRSQVRPLDNGVEFASGVCCDYEFPPHVHAGLTLGLVVSGREEIQYKNSVTRVERGAIYLIPPDTIHAARSYEKSGWSYYSVYIPHEHVERLLTGVNRDETKIEALVIKNAHAHHIARQLMALNNSQDRLQSEVCLVDALNAAYAPASDDAKFNKGARTASCSSIRKVLEYIDAFYMDSISLNQLAGLAGWSVQYLISAFRKQTGATPYAYLIARRLCVARSRVLKGESLSAIAADCGFFDQSHLNRHFVRVFGVSPAAYAKSLHS